MKPKRSFWEYVKNPSLFWSETREADDADGVPAPGNRRLAGLVAAMYTSQPEYKDLQRLRKAGANAVPHLSAALRDPRFLFQRYGTYESAMATALGSGATIAEAVPLLDDDTKALYDYTIPEDPASVLGTQVVFPPAEDDGDIVGLAKWNEAWQDFKLR